MLYLFSNWNNSHHTVALPHLPMFYVTSLNRLVRNCFQCNTNLRTKNKHFLKQNFSASITLIQGHFGFMALPPPPGPREPKFPFDIGLREFTNEDWSSKQPHFWISPYMNLKTSPPQSHISKPMRYNHSIWLKVNSSQSVIMVPSQVKFYRFQSRQWVHDVEKYNSNYLHLPSNYFSVNSSGPHSCNFSLTKPSNPANVSKWNDLSSQLLSLKQQSY